jgi:hypothetical protein
MAVLTFIPLLMTVCVLVSATHPVSRAQLFNSAGAQLIAAMDAPTASANATPSVLQRDGDWAQVAVVNSDPKALDGIVAYSPANATIGQTAPIEYFLLTDVNPDYLTTGTATANFRLINMRSDYVFYVMRDVPNSPSAIATSNVVTFANLNQPRALRLLLTGRTTEMRVMWSSAVSNLNPRVEWWQAGTEIPAAFPTAAANTSTYTAADMCNAPAITIGYRDIGIINTAIMTGLQPGVQYMYRVGDDSEMTDIYDVSAVVQADYAAVTNNYPSSLRLVVYGDMGQAHLDGAGQVLQFPPAPNTTRRVAEQIDAGWPDAIIHVGDIAYSCGYSSLWDVFFSMMDAYGVSSRVPYHIILGNHESDDPSPKSGSYYNGTDSGGECSVPATHLFLNPQPAINKPWYVLALGPLTAIHISTEFNFTTGSEQWTFIRDTIAAVNKTITPWTALFLHRPMYVDSNGTTPPWGSQPVSHLLQQHVEPLFFDDNGDVSVDLVIGGHFHDYQRHCAIKNYTCMTRSSGPLNVFTQPLAPVHLVVGTAGAPISCCRYVLHKYVCVLRAICLIPLTCA